MYPGILAACGIILSCDRHMFKRFRLSNITFTLHVSSRILHYLNEARIPHPSPIEKVSQIHILYIDALQYLHIFTHYLLRQINICGNTIVFLQHSIFIQYLGFLAILTDMNSSQIKISTTTHSEIFMQACTWSLTHMKYYSMVR